MLNQRQRHACQSEFDCFFFSHSDSQRESNDDEDENDRDENDESESDKNDEMIQRENEFEK
jgi:transcriptional regulator of met regulon